MIQILEQQGFSGEIRPEESMKSHCTFKTGGKAELFLIPRRREDLILCRQICLERGIPLFILGGGANILVSDKGIPGVTISLEGLNDMTRRDNLVICEAGQSVNRLVSRARDWELTGLEFLTRLPGSVGGALFMNARCYGSEISDILSWADYLDEENRIRRLEFHREDWEYKKSPFQRDDWVILNAAFHLKNGNKESISFEMDRIARDRIEKGHFKAPSAGSTFKNNRAFGKPSGRIIDECGFKGLEQGGASVSSWHGNIFINRNDASSQDISLLIDHVQCEIEKKTGYHLEPEVIRVGDWNY